MALASAAQHSTVPKVQARVALVALDPAAIGILRECFKQFGIECVPLQAEEAELQFNRQKFEACVVHLDDVAPAILTAVRTSRSNNRMVVYGICATAQEALRFSQYSINAVFSKPVDRQNALKVVRGTHLLVLHELRRYVRIPMVCPVELTIDNQRYKGSMHEISGGGMSMQISIPLTIGHGVEVCFRLPKIEELSLKAAVAWVRPDQKLVGIRFDLQETNRFRVKNWIDQYLDIN